MTSIKQGAKVAGMMLAATIGTHCGSAHASGAPAAGGVAADVPDIKFERYTLDNGLEVILHSDRSVPLVAVDVWYHVGSGDEELGRSGFAHLFEHMMFQGAKHIGRDVHFDLLRKIGASRVNGTTNKDRTNYYEVVPSHYIETALWLESDRMGYLLDTLDADSLKNQQDVVRNERRQRYDNVPYGKDRFEVAAGLYPDEHPYRFLTIGRHEDIESASLGDVREFFRRWYVPSNATLVIAGDFAPKDGKALVEKWFGGFPKLSKPVRSTPELPTLVKTTRTEINDLLARYVRVHYAWHSPARLEEGDAELRLLSLILGANGWGRLYKSLVVEKELAQSVSVYQSGSGFSGEFHVVVNIRPGRKLAEVEPIIEAAIKEASASPPSAQELRRAVNRVESRFIFGFEELLTRAERLQFFNHYSGDPGYVPKYLETIRTRSEGDLQKAAAATLSRPRVEVITLPPGAK